MQGRKEDDILNRLKEMFRLEAAEHLQAMTAGLLELERGAGEERAPQVIEEVFRRAHSLKGAARAVNLADVESTCQSLENIFSGWKKGETTPDPNQYDQLHRALRGIEATVGESVAVPSVASEPAEPMAASQTTVRIETEKLDHLLLEAEELLTVKVNMGRGAERLKTLQREVDRWHEEWSRLEPAVSELRREGGRGTGEVLSFLDWNLNTMRLIEERLRSAAGDAQQDQILVGRRIDELLTDSKRLLMMPLTSLLDLFPKLVRDIAREQGKDVDLTLKGGEIEVDKRILEQMKDPLVHLVRNCVDHGVERPELRASRGKPPRASIVISATRLTPSFIEIRVSDDGAGIDGAQVVRAAAKQAGNEEGAFDLIFRSGVSTSPIITEISGLGLGLAIVRESVERLGGGITVESEPGRGTVFRISLPTILATFRGVLVEAAGQEYILPTPSLERVARVRFEDIKTVENRETITIDGRPMALTWLDSVLEIPRKFDTDQQWVSVAILIWRGERIAFGVDLVRHEEEILVKPLSRPFSKVPHISGATTLGSARVVPVLDVGELFESAKRSGFGPRQAAPTQVKAARRLSILVAEDSITSRMLIKSILESAGHDVTTAVDGMDALTALRTGSYDLVVSDVEMPRMNGFDLTTQIRSDKNLSDKPVILVTALASREDRERGIEVGANAYIVKSSFDQSNLLEAVDRLA